jgi:spore coat polysaccharide biosynthesis protein SpsF (cytidylyltransferase family)
LEKEKMKKKIIAIIQARTGATRLPNKVLFNLEGKTVLERVIDRVKQSKLIDDVVVATTVNKEDLAIVNICSKNKISVYCGSENDVLDRYYQAARLFGADHAVRITADCPLMDPKIIDKIIKLHLQKKADYTTNCLKVTYPDGEDVEVFTFKTLLKAWKRAHLSSEREHVTAYIRNRPKVFKLKNYEYSKNLSDKRWTLDEPSDYKFIKIIYKKLYSTNKLFGMEDVLKLLKKRPELEKINSNIIRNQGYLKSLKHDKVVKINQ